MKKIIFIQLVTLLFSTVSYAQNTDCNRDVWVKQDEKKYPKEFVYLKDI